MFASAEKSSHSSLQLKAQNATPAFFRKAGEGDFLGKSDQPAFFGNVIQAKLSVSSPNDPQEKEADAMADRVMRMPDTALVQPQMQNEDEQVNRKEEDEENLQTSREGNVPCSGGCAEKGTIQTKYGGSLFRQAVDSIEGADYADDGLHADAEVQRKAIGLHRSDVIQLSGRGPPAGLPHVSFEQNLSSSKGGGSALPEATRTFMESRFGADFGGVRIHTGEKAIQLSQTIHAHAFTHGNDIYFNQGKYNPNSASGGNLLAHELTHTLQQGASQPKSQAASPSASGVSRKIQRAAAGVPVQLTNAVEKAKTVEGKIDANKPQADGNRTGYEHLLEIFKTTFGEEMIVRNGGSAVKGAVAEDDIKKKRIQDGVMVVDTTTRTDRTSAMGTKTGSRDAMPSWCGIFVFWALNKSGVPMPKWKLGERMIPLEAARAPGAMPMPGDIAYRNAFSHFAIVESVQGSTVRTVNGNTAGEDNLGGQVQTIEHPLSEWSAFFNPLQVMTGSLGDGEQAGNPVPKTIAELRKEQPIQAKTKTGEEEELQTKQAPELSNFVVGPAGSIEAKTDTTAKQPVPIQRQEDPAIEEEEEVSETAQSLHLNRFAHEAQWQPTHTIYQRSAIEPLQHGGKELYSEKPNHTSANLQNIQSKPLPQSDRGPPVLQRQASGNPAVQRSPIDVAFAGVTLGELLDCVYVTDLNRTSICLLRKASAIAMRIPGYKALRVVLGKDPISGVQVERNGHNLLDAAFDIMPGGTYFKAKLKETGKLDAAAQWIDGKIDGLQRLVNNLLAEFDNFWNRLGITDFRAPMEVLRRGAGIVFDFIGHLVRFATDAVKELLGMIKQVLLRKLVEFIKENTNAYPLLTVILGEDPITKEKVAPTGTNILHAILELGGEEGRMQRTQMQETGSFAKAAAFIDEGIAVFGNLYQSIIANFNLIWDSVNIQSLMQPVATFRRIFNGFAQPIRRVLDFVKRVGIEILKLIKEALMQRLSTWARTVRGYTLVTVIIGSDPFTGQNVPFTMDNVIRGFFGLMDGGEAQYDELKQSGAIDRTVAKVTKAVQRLNMTPAAIIQLFVGLWNSFSLRDLMNPMVAFRRILDRFGSPIRRLIAFVVEIVKIVVVAILEIMNFPFDLINNIISRTIAAFHRIKNDPIAFLKNLLGAIKQGFIQFFNNILTHLMNGVVGWLMAELRDANVPAPTDFSLRGIIGWVLQVLGISMDVIWAKLATHPRIGPERVARLRSMINTLEGIWTFIRDVQERGIAAIWERIQEQLSNLWNTVLDAVKNWIMERIVTQVTARLLSMLDPTGIMAVVNSAIAIFRAIQSFIRYLRQMLEVINSFVNGVADIAEGNVTTAANYLEATMGRAMPIVVGFLANQVGLSGIGRRIAEMITSVREMVDRALTWLVNRAVDTGFAIFDRLMSMGRNVVNAALAWARGLLGLQQPFTTPDGVGHRIYYAEEGNTVKLKLNPAPAGDYEVKMNEINPAAGATVTLTSAISVPLRRNGANVGTVNVPAGAVPMQDLKDAALQVARHIDGLIRSNMRTSTTTTTRGTTTSVQDQTPDFGASLVGLSSITSHLLSASASGPLPVTPMPTYGGLVNGYASSMDVKPLTKLGVPGTNVGVTATNWENLNLRKHSPGPSGSFYYIRGHLLNNNVHGSGSTWQNLTPIQRSTNAQHVTNVENKVKEAVDKGLILHYNVTVDYAMPRKDNLIAQIEVTTNWQTNSELNEKHKILEAEAQLPLRLNCTVKQIKADGTDLPSSDPTYDAKYNISGAPGVIDNAVNVAQDNLSIYYLAGTTAVTYKDLPKLLTDAGLAIAADASITWDAFYGNAVNTLSIDNLSVTDRETLRNAFRKKDYIKDERNRIEGQMTIVSWGAFTAGRVAYSSGLLTPADVQELHNRFKNRMLTNKGFQLSALATYVNTSLTDPNTTWQSFKFVQQLTAKEYDGPDGNHHVILSELDIQSFRTNVFDPRIAALRSASAAAPPSVTPPTGPTTGTP